MEYPDAVRLASMYNPPPAGGADGRIPGACRTMAISNTGDMLPISGALPASQWLAEAELWWEANCVPGVEMRFGGEYLPYALEIDHLKSQETGRGWGTEAMTRIVQWADANGVTLMVMPAGYSHPNPRLVEFYSRFDFDSDNGGETMYRM